MPTRRTVLATLLTVPLLRGGGTSAQEASPTPSCGEATAAQTAGPFYSPDSPLKRDLFRDVAEGERIRLSGRVIDTSCAPVVGAVVDIWHADRDGDYDNTGFRLRGHQVTDASGQWSFLTIETVRYSSRTAHYHFRVHTPGKTLTTQLYFPDHPRNGADRMFDPRLVLAMGRDGSLPVGRFDFVV